MLGLALALISGATSQADPKSASPVETEKTFTIESTEESVDSLPYPTTHKITTLKWNSPTPMLSFVLEDDGESMQAHSNVGPDKEWTCSSTSRLLAFDVKARSLFRPGFFIPDTCAKALLKGRTLELRRKERIRELRRMIDIAARDFPTAYADFVRATKLQHGPSERRCKEYVHGHHGLICERFSDEKN
jgi:hypothetical protein